MEIMPCKVDVLHIEKSHGKIVGLRLMAESFEIDFTRFGGNRIVKVGAVNRNILPFDYNCYVPQEIYRYAVEFAKKIFFKKKNKKTRKRDRRKKKIIWQ